MKNRRENFGAKEISTLAVMTSLSVVGRIVFSVVPFFKPVTAMTVIAGMAFGPAAGLVVGSASALISNFYFGQGPWTIFQIIAWGLIGLIAGIIRKPLVKSKILLSVYGIISGVFFSLFLDVFTTFWMDRSFNLARYIFFVIEALPVTIVYAISNVIFLLILAKPILDKVTRVKLKYGIFERKNI